ncbi:ABC-2 type transport system ATP-binding protein [Ereboglobus sp. PH5-10]|uniref:ABC transporter ATP-binding protein n=1 Tax=Ereboglobus sp. PH5-10 TaxID=2940629 RepID=UPI002406275E|nr:ABC transporter ATP-binding protein [Ereboglobus sp. PH5-10]MDF9826440.1 ABC-2 type transport system ATP-binding protein [Ereboglobus sp. PH5-10]
MLSIRSITKRFGGFTALDEVSLEISPGECFGLLGPNGAGKTTLMSLIAGLRKPDGGMISPGKSGARASLGLVPQNVALYTDLTAGQNLEIFGKLQGLRGATLRERVGEALEAVQLSERRKDVVKTFSGGMQRRLNLAAALLHRPGLLLCDEPTVGVDPQSRNAIFDYLGQLNRDGLTIIYSTHYMEEAARLCSRIGIIDHGKILALGTLDELLALLPFEDEIIFPNTSETKLFAERMAPHGKLVSENGAQYRFFPQLKLSEFYRRAEELNLPARLFAQQRPTLEAVFLHLTGRTLRDTK